MPIGEQQPLFRIDIDTVQIDRRHLLHSFVGMESLGKADEIPATFGPKATIQQHGSQRRCQDYCRKEGRKSSPSPCLPFTRLLPGGPLGKAYDERKRDRHSDRTAPVKCRVESQKDEKSGTHREQKAPYRGPKRVCQYKGRS